MKKFKLDWKKVAYAVIGDIILAFGLYQVHSISDITEGGVLGLQLLLEHWLGISPAVSSVLIDGTCYIIGLKVLGWQFILYSVIGCGAYSLSYWCFEQYPRLWPSLAQHPLFSAILGALFVGVGVGLSLRGECAPGGDDTIALVFNRVWNIKLERVYLISDVVVLLASLSYIPPKRIAYSLLTVVLSGQLIGIIERAKLPIKLKDRIKAKNRLKVQK